MLLSSRLNIQLKDRGIILVMIFELLNGLTREKLYHQIELANEIVQEINWYLEYTLQGIQLLGCVAVLKNSEGLSYLVVLR